LSAFDLAAHQRERIRHLGLENEALRRHRDQLERLLAIALQVATGKTKTTPMALLGVLEEFDALVNETPAEKVLRVLRETA
jgi:hypothetical protein